MRIDAFEEDDAVQHRRTRYWLYWISSVVATLIFLFFMTTMLLVPGILATAKLEMLSIVGIVTVISICIGVWKPSATDAPLAAPPLGPAMGVILLAELAMCLFSIAAILVRS
jgi:membrane-associated HD superfamily phosphohydrolase